MPSWAWSPSSRTATGASTTSLEPGRGDLRVLRGGLVGATAVALGVAGHTSAGGAPPNAGIAAGLGILATVVAARLSRRRWTLASLVAGLALAQAIFHVAFLAGPAGSASAAEPAAGSGATMVAGHTVAAVCMAVLLRYGDGLWWRLAGLLSRGVLALARPSARRSPVWQPVRLGEPALEVERSGLMLARRSSRRGPPSLLAREPRS
jgi:hypothetical protein